MYGYLLDCPEPDTVESGAVVTGELQESRSDLFMTRHQKERQRAYDRARHLAATASIRILMPRTLKPKRP